MNSKLYVLLDPHTGRYLRGVEIEEGVWRGDGFTPDMQAALIITAKEDAEAWRELSFEVFEVRLEIAA